jgi:tRNA-specific 2-thiouridylase
LPVFLQQQLAAKQGNIHEILPSWRGYNKPTDGQEQEQEQKQEQDLEKLSMPYRYTVRDGKKIGTHNGAHFYTIGQRKGLGIGGRKESLFIISTDVKENVIYVGEGDSHPGLYRKALRIQPSEVHWVEPSEAMREGESRDYMVRIRYRQPLQKATLEMRSEGLYIVFDEPQRGIAAGQFAAWYEGENLAGSGVIEA